MTSGAASLNVKSGNVGVCHVTGKGSYQLLSVSPNALAPHQAHGDLVVGVDADENCLPLTGNTPPVAFDNPEGWVPEFPYQNPGVFQGTLVATDADADVLTFSIVPGSFFPAGPDDLDTFGNGLVSFTLDPATGEWSSFCLGGYNGGPNGYGSFQFVANDGQADSNVATQYFDCFI